MGEKKNGKKFRQLCSYRKVAIARVCNMKNQPPSFGKLTFIPCRTPWYLNKRTLKVQILQLVWQKCSQGQRLSWTLVKCFWSSICASNLVTSVLYDISGVIWSLLWDLVKEQWETPPTRAFLINHSAQLFCGHKPSKSKCTTVRHNKYIMWFR